MLSSLPGDSLPEISDLSDVLGTAHITYVCPTSVQYTQASNSNTQETAEQITSPQPAQFANSEEQVDDTDSCLQLCVLCYKTFKTLSDLTLHFIKHGLAESRMIQYMIFCEVCGEVFDNTDLLEKHQRIIHTRLAWPCELCQLNFANEVELLRHNQSHDSITPDSACSEENLQCALCVKQLPNKHLLTEHIAEHLMKKFRCRICSKCYYTRAAFVNHLRIHNYKHECEICGWLFVSKAKLQIHIKGVHDRISSLQSHGKVNNNRKKLHRCEFCSYHTARAGDLQVRAIQTFILPFNLYL